MIKHLGGYFIMATIIFNSKKKQFHLINESIIIGGTINAQE